MAAAGVAQAQNRRARPTHGDVQRSLDSRPGQPQPLARPQPDGGNDRCPCARIKVRRHQHQCRAREHDLSDPRRVAAEHPAFTVDHRLGKACQAGGGHVLHGPRSRQSPHHRVKGDICPYLERNGDRGGGQHQNIVMSTHMALISLSPSVSKAACASASTTAIAIARSRSRPTLLPQPSAPPARICTSATRTSPG